MFFTIILNEYVINIIIAIIVVIITDSQFYVNLSISHTSLMEKFLFIN